MKSRKKSHYAALAMLGILSAGCESKEPEPGQHSDKTATDKSCCMGKNACKGQGGCANPGKNSCAGKNACKGQGGCNMHCKK